MEGQITTILILARRINYFQHDYNLLWLAPCHNGFGAVIYVTNSDAFSVSSPSQQQCPVQPSPINRQCAIGQLLVVQIVLDYDPKISGLSDSDSVPFGSR